MFLVEIAQYILYKGVVKMDIQEKINNQFEKVSNELDKTILGDMQEEFIGKRKDIVKFLKEEINACKKFDYEVEVQEAIKFAEEFIKELEKFEENDVVGVFIHPMDEGLHLMEQAKLLEELENWI